MNKKEIKQEVDYLDTLQRLTSAYAQISSGRMLKIRQGVLSSRDFLDELNDLFKDLRRSYQAEILQLQRRRGKKGEQITFLAHNGKTVAVFLSANTGLYGELVVRTFESFVKEIEETGAEAAIVGRLGLALFLSRYPNRSYTYFDFPDYGSDPDNFLRLVRHLVQYEEIHLHFGQFQSLVTQKPSFVNIAAESPIGQGVVQGEQVKYLFEPSLEEIMIFFETEMFASVLEQTMSESQLAKFASRMMSMDRANQNIVVDLKKVQLLQLKLSHSLQNKKQLENIWSLVAIRQQQRQVNI